jgi:ribosome recycling factor
MVTEALGDARERMNGAVEALGRDLASVRTSRASAGLVDNIKVDYQGMEMPLGQLAQISAADARMLLIQPWDKTAVGAIERAIMKSDIGMSPNVDGQAIRLVVPPLTEERRRDIVKMVRKRAEEARISVRNVRRDVMERIRSLEKGGEVSQDESKRAQNDLQKLTDDAVGKVDAAISEKEAEVMQV